MFENFLTWETLLTYAGCVSGTVVVTEWVKKMLPKLNSQIVSFVTALTILLVGRWATGTFVVGDIGLYLVNAMVVSLAANGGFDAIKGMFGKKEAAVADGLIVVDENGENGADMYVDLNADPAAYKEGDILTFKVRKASQNEPSL